MLELNRRVILEEGGIPVILKLLTTHKNLKMTNAIIDTLTHFAREGISMPISISISI